MVRDPSLDIGRGLGIVLVILGHVSFLNENLHRAVYSVHIPFFFLLSGYLFNPGNITLIFSHFALKRFYRLILPAWCIGMMCGLPFVGLYLGGKLSGEDFLHRLTGTLTGATAVADNFFVTPIWFLFCLFISELLLYLLLRCSVSKRELLAFSVLGAVISKLVALPVYFNIHIAFLCLPLLVLGYLCRQISFTDRCASTVVCFFIWCGCLFLSQTAVDLSAMTTGTGRDLLFNILAALTGSYVLFSVSTHISSRFLILAGRNTLIILGFNYYVNALVKFLFQITDSHYSVTLSFLMQLILFYLLIKGFSYFPRLYTLLNGGVFVSHGVKL